MMCDRESRLYDAVDAWHNKFYQNVTSKIDEDIFKPLYKEGNMGAPNASIRILVGMSILKEGCGCSDEQLYERCRYDLLFRRALGLIGLDEQCPSIDTYYCLRRRICEYEEKHGENLFEVSLLYRVFHEQYEVQSDGTIVIRDKKLVSASSLQNPNDPDATYRNKTGKKVETVHADGAYQSEGNHELAADTQKL